MRSKLALLLASIIIFTSCDDKLTNSRSETSIKERFKFPYPETVTLTYGYLDYTGPNLPDVYIRLDSAGIFSIESLGKDSTKILSYNFRVNLTEEGRKYLHHEDQKPKRLDNGELFFKSSFTTNKVEFLEISKIQEIPALNSAIVAFKLKRVDFNPMIAFYKDYKQVIAKPEVASQLEFIKTNNGWELNK